MSAQLSVGQRLPTVAAAPISRTTLALFAGASGDHNPIHIDTDVAHSAGLDDVFAHGMLSMAYLGRVLTQWQPQSHLRNFHVRFTAITPVHGEPTCSGTVVAIDGDLIDIELAVRLADGTVTVTGTARMELADKTTGGQPR